MRPLVASTGPRATVSAGLAALRAGGNALDAVAAAALAWPPGLAAAGSILVLGPGVGRVTCRLPARVPGLGLSRPRRLRLLAAGAPGSLFATPSVAPALGAALARWGALGLQGAAAAAAADRDLPHRLALEAIVEAGAGAAVKGPWALAAARTLGPLAGGLLTRRDLIEARALLATASEVAEGWPATEPLGDARPRLEAHPGELRLLLLVALDRQGTVAAAALEAGVAVEGLGPVLGVEPNSLLHDGRSGAARRVGHRLPAGVGCAALVERELRLVACGPLAALERLVAEGGGLEAGADSDLLVVRTGPRPSVSAAATSGTL